MNDVLVAMVFGVGGLSPASVLWLIAIGKQDALSGMAEEGTVSSMLIMYTSMTKSLCQEVGEQRACALSEGLRDKRMRGIAVVFGARK